MCDTTVRATVNELGKAIIELDMGPYLGKVRQEKAIETSKS